MEKNESDKFNLTTFVANRKDSLEELAKKLNQPTLMENIKNYNKIYNGLNQEIPEWYKREDLQQFTSGIIDTYHQLLADFTRFIGSLVKNRNRELLYNENVDIPYLVSRYDIALPTGIPYDIKASPNFTVESAEDKIDKRILIVMQNGPEEINLALETSVNKRKSLYALILKINTDLDDLKKSTEDSKSSNEKETGKVENAKLENTTKDEQLENAKLENTTKDEQLLKSKVFSQDRHCIRMVVPSQTDSFDDAFNCVFAWITEVELLQEKDAEAWANEGKNMMTRQPEEAIASFNRALVLDPNNIRALSGIGEIRYNLGEYKEAITSFDKALQKQPDDPQILNAKGEALVKLGQYKEAIASFDKALQKKPSDGQILNAKGEALVKLGQYKEAMEYFDRISDEESIFIKQWYSQGIALFNLRRYEEALTSFDKALQKQPDDPQILNAKGETLIKLGRYDNAVDIYDRSIKLDRSNSTFWKNRALALESLKRYDEALKSYDKAIELNPKDKISKDAREKIIQALSKERMDTETKENLIQLIKSGNILHFNSFRKTTPGLDLTGQKFDHIIMKEINLSGTILVDTSFEFADLSGADLSGADLTRAHMNNVILKQANLKETNLNKASMAEANLKEASLYGTNFAEAKLFKAELSNAFLRKTNLSETDLKEASFYNSLILFVNLTNASLTNTDFRGSVLVSNNLTGANFSAANLSNSVIINPVTTKTTRVNISTDVDGAIIDDHRFFDILKKSIKKLPEEIKNKKDLLIRLQGRNQSKNFTYLADDLIKSIIEESVLPD